MKRYMLTIAYDGTGYCGWQLQPGQATVEGIINEKLSKLLKENIEVIGASRTDSGVHAMGNVAVFDTETRIPAEKICYALNHELPEDIVIQSSREVPGNFHPRKCDSFKTYEYKVWNAEFVQPFSRKYTYFVYKKLDVDAMNKAAEALIGTHDFTSFCSVHTQVPDHVRTIYSAEWKKEGNLLTFRIRGNGFLYNMVRIIAGTLIQVGLGERSAESLKETLSSCNREAAGPTAPPQGLTLVGIEFPDLQEK
ncbi:MAG: tRNA pseudouridine(38-40) synthase TruA [Lachnospiraceae bacterium]|nr:tRNA pseudouridine(38-40) synthase TruA [Lachnospiraceae bacterium]